MKKKTEIMFNKLRFLIKTKWRKNMEKIKVGYIYKDRRNFDVLIVRYFPSDDKTSTQNKYPYEGVVLAKATAFVNWYTEDGIFKLDTCNEWEKDLIVESSKVWNPLQLNITSNES